MISPNEFHPILVHFPIALLLLVFLLDLAALKVREDWLRKASMLLLVVGATLSVPAYLAGDYVRHTATFPNATALHIVAAHEFWAKVSVFLFGLLAAWRVLLRGAYPQSRSVYLLGAFLGVISLTITGYLGGMLTYHYGVGNTHVQAVPAAATHRSAPPVSPAVIAVGQRIYAQTCSVCHGPLGQGGPSAGPLGPYLSQYGSASQIASMIQSAMPLNNPGSLSPQQANAVTRYILHG